MDGAIADGTDEELRLLATNWDHHCPAFRDRRQEVLRFMAEQCPVGHSEHYGGFWVVSKYETLRQVACMTEAVSSAQGINLPRKVLERMIPIESDQPEHMQYRRVLTPLLSPQKMADEAPRIRALAIELAQRAKDRGRFDLVKDLAQPLTGMTTLRLIGFPADEWHEYAAPIHDIAYSVPDEDLPRRRVAFSAMAERAKAEIRRQRANPVPGTILASLFAAEIDGRALTEAEIDSIILLLVGAGLDTTQAGVSFFAVYLGRNPERRKELIEHPDLLPSAMEELLRLSTPTQALLRTAIQDFEVDGHRFKAGDKVMLVFAAANLDPTEFEKPEDVDFLRKPNRHLAFGIGAHRCLGSHLARVEILACIEALLKVVPNYRLREDELELSADVGVILGYPAAPIDF